MNSREELAEVIHKARWPADRQIAITPFADEDRSGREYCLRIADAILANGIAERPLLDTKAFAAELRKWWSFSDRQIHTHSWHDREDFIEKKLPELLATVTDSGRLTFCERCNANRFHRRAKIIEGVQTFECPVCTVISTVPEAPVQQQLIEPILQARRAEGEKWIEIYPAQVEWMNIAGYQLRAFDTTSHDGTKT